MGVKFLIWIIWGYISKHAKFRGIYLKTLIFFIIIISEGKPCHIFQELPTGHTISSSITVAAFKIHHGIICYRKLDTYWRHNISAGWSTFPIQMQSIFSSMCHSTFYEIFLKFSLQHATAEVILPHWIVAYWSMFLRNMKSILQ